VNASPPWRLGKRRSLIAWTERSGVKQTLVARLEKSGSPRIAAYLKQ
jgi:hypothetical protein